jgi:hypothetical protein
MVEFAEKLGRYRQSRLSQFETRSEGPPLDIVKQYADFFELIKEKRYDFFLAALESSSQILLDPGKISPVVRGSIFKLLAIFLSNDTIGDTIKKWQVANETPLDYSPYLDYNKPYRILGERWKDLDKVINDFLAEEVNPYKLLPEPVTPNPKTAQPKTEPHNKQPTIPKE